MYINQILYIHNSFVKVLERKYVAILFTGCILLTLCNIGCILSFTMLFIAKKCGEHKDAAQGSDEGMM